MNLPVTLRCRACGATLPVVAEKTDPRGTAEIVGLCPDCETRSYLVTYHDKAGKLLRREWQSE